MSDDKTEEPTQKKLNDARKKGQVAQSKDVSSTVMLAVVLAFLFIGGNWIFSELSQLVAFAGDCAAMPFDEALPRMRVATTTTLLKILIPLAGIVALFAIAGGFSQVGPLLAFEPLKPELKKLNPIEKAKQTFSMKNIMEFLKSAFKVIFLGVLLFTVIRGELPNLIEIPYTGLAGAQTMLSQILFRIFTYTIGAFIVVAVADFFYQRYQHTKGLKMSKDEVKREFKEMEGSPEIKGKRKQLHQEMVMSGNVEKAKKATVLVTNPTHRAIAIQYHEGDDKLPIVTAKAEGAVAMRMIKAAKEAGVPITRNIPLATDLFFNADVEQYIPVELIGPIAEVLRWVRELRQEDEGSR